MTTIAFRDGIMAADSCITMSDESAGDYKGHTVKLLECEYGICGLQGDSTPGMAFWHWWRHGMKDDALAERIRASGADFTALTLEKDGLYVWDSWLLPELVTDEFYAIGSGTKAALGALHMGASAVEAVQIACLIDPYTAAPVLSKSYR
jgi:hypothetical protein